jgi:raffinose/stachyose/melibiose transport system permease protein
VGFTLFFTLFNVIAANLLASSWPWRLDTKIRSRNILRSVFFLPNVLSMIVVALIWSFVFFHLLPTLTGVERWMSDPAKAPGFSSWCPRGRRGYYMVIYLAGLQNIPGEVREAALIDGRLLATTSEDNPAPSHARLHVCLFLSIANSLKSFDLVYAL